MRIGAGSAGSPQVIGARRTDAGASGLTENEGVGACQETAGAAAGVEGVARVADGASGGG